MTVRQSNDFDDEWLETNGRCLNFIDSLPQPFQWDLHYCDCNRIMCKTCENYEWNVKIFLVAQKPPRKCICVVVQRRREFSCSLIQRYRTRTLLSLIISMTKIIEINGWTHWFGFSIKSRKHTQTPTSAIHIRWHGSGLSESCVVSVCALVRIRCLRKVVRTWQNCLNKCVRKSVCSAVVVTIPIYVACRTYLQHNISYQIRIRIYSLAFV